MSRRRASKISGTQAEVSPETVVQAPPVRYDPVSPTQALAPQQSTLLGLLGQDHPVGCLKAQKLESAGL